MQISARYQAVFEILTEVFKDKKPADLIIQEYVRSRKYIGSKDRRFITDTVWEIIRRRMRLCFEAQSEDARKILLVYLKDKDLDLVTGLTPYGLKAVTKEEKAELEKLRQDPYPAYVELECPKWLFEKINHPNLAASLNRCATLDIRSNFVDRFTLQKRLQAEGLFFSLTAYSPYGLRSEEKPNLNNCMAFQEGLFDVQDESSQLAAILCDVSPDERVIDYCAGAGGKSLAISAHNHNEGTIYAHDADFNRMDPIKMRAQRLGIKNIKIVRELDPNRYDRFIVDAPCSGSGTWRRSPDAKFRLTPQKLAELNLIQTQILEIAYKNTLPGGKIIYMTCSVLNDENQNMISAFLQSHPDIKPVDHKKLWERKIDQPYLFETRDFIQFSPLKTNSDGFFFCMMQKDKKED